MPRASVIVPARDAAGTLPRALAAIAGQDLEGGFEVIVVDNGSRDATADLAAGSGVVDQVIRRARGEGPGAARNAGAARAGAEVLAFLDADCRPAPGWLAEGVAATNAAPFVQGRVLPDPEVEPRPFDRTLSVGGAHGLFESANLFVKRDLFTRLGGFGAGLEPSGAPFGEDVVFGWRARRAGAGTAFASGALAYHAVFRRSAREFLAERGRLSLFAELVSQVPELREAFFYRRWFFSRSSAAFDLAVAGAVVAILDGERLPLLAGLPYAVQLQRAARRWGWRRGAVVAVVEMAADARGALALASGSARARTLVL